MKFWHRMNILLWAVLSALLILAGTTVIAVTLLLRDTPRDMALDIAMVAFGVFYIGLGAASAWAEFGVKWEDEDLGS